MTPESFVAGLVRTAHEGAISSTIAILEAPGGRRPPLGLDELSKWYIGRNDGDKARLRSVVEHAVHAAIFGALCVLDGVSTIESRGEKTEFLLTARRNGVSSQLNGPNMELLHDLYQNQVYERVFGASS
jgi:hypothetical protein